MTPEQFAEMVKQIIFWQLVVPVYCAVFAPLIAYALRKK